MKQIIVLFSALAIQAAVFAQTTWKNDKPHSQLSFTISHLGINEVTGNFKSFDVTVTASKDDFSDAVFELKADVNSINTEVEMRDNHLKTADFFDVATYPAMTFKSTSMKKAGKDKYKLTGDLTLHGITKTVTLDLWYRGTISHPMTKQPDAGFQVTGTIKRSDFNLGGKYPAPMLSDEVQIKADGEFAK